MGKISALRDVYENVKRKALPGILAGGVILCAGAAQAQTTVPVQHPLSIKLGALIPTNSAATHNGGSAQISAGVDYAIGKTTEDNPTIPSIYADYNGGSHDGGHVNTYGVGVAVRGYGDKPGAANKSGTSPYLGAGVGVYHSDIKNTRGGVVRSGNTTSVGGKVFAGVEFSQNYFIEANYQFLPSKEGVNPSGVGLQIGARF
jgi:opacity protein-like surface antigen